MSKGHARCQREMPRDLDAPTVVIVHGAWARCDGLARSDCPVTSKGLERHRRAESASSLADDVDAVTRAIKHHVRPIVLVGQGYGGTVITQAGNHPRVAALVFVVGFRAGYRRIDERCAEGLSAAAMRR